MVQEIQGLLSGTIRPSGLKFLGLATWLHLDLGLSFIFGFWLVFATETEGSRVWFDFLGDLSSIFDSLQNHLPSPLDLPFC